MSSRHISHVEYARFGNVEGEKGNSEKPMAFQISGIMLMIPIKVSLISLLPLLYNRRKEICLITNLFKCLWRIIMTIPKIQVSFSSYYLYTYFLTIWKHLACWRKPCRLCWFRTGKRLTVSAFTSKWERPIITQVNNCLRAIVTQGLHKPLFSADRQTSRLLLLNWFFSVQILKK